MATFVGGWRVGSRTVREHLQRIVGTPESRELVDGVRQEARSKATDVVRRAGGAAARHAETSATKAIDDLLDGALGLAAPAPVPPPQHSGATRPGGQRRRHRRPAPEAEGARRP
jgi:hypothetical protein